MKYDTATPYLAVYVLFEREGKYLFVKRASTGYYDGYYGLPSGKVEKAEAGLAAAVREVKEEVGLDITAEQLRHACTVHRQEGNYWVDVVFIAQGWEGTPVNGEPHKHSEIAWFAPYELPDNIVPAVYCIFEQIAAGKAYGEFGWEKL